MGTLTSGVPPLAEYGVLGDPDSGGLVRVRLPPVYGVGLRDVDDEEPGPITQLLIEGLQGASLAPEGRSRVAPEDEHHGPIVLGRDVHGVRACFVPVGQYGQGERGHGVAYLQTVGSSIRHERAPNSLLLCGVSCLGQRGLVTWLHEISVYRLVHMLHLAIRAVSFPAEDIEYYWSQVNS